MKFFTDFYRVFGIPILWLAHFTKHVLYLLSHNSEIAVQKTCLDIISHNANFVKCFSDFISNKFRQQNSNFKVSLSEPQREIVRSAISGIASQSSRLARIRCARRF